MIACRICCYVLFSFCLVGQWTYSHGQQTGRLLQDKTQVIQICKQKDTCSCVRSDGTGINLHHLDKGPKPRFTSQAQFGLIQWNPCSGFKVQSDTGVAVAYGLKNMNVFGYQKNAKFNIFKNKDTIEYTTSDTASRIILFCNESAKPTFIFGSEGGSYVTGVYYGPCNPTPTPTPSISTGSLIVIAFFSIIIIYFTIGCFVNIYVRKADGRERIPNYTIWSELLKLIRDGCCFTVLCCRRNRAYEDI